MWAGSKDSNPVALYLLVLHVIPSIPIDTPLPLFPIDNYRLLAFCVLLPAAFRLNKSKDDSRIRGITAMDVLLLGFGVMQTAFYVRPDLPDHMILADSFTNGLRRATLFFIDIYLLYFVVSRYCSSRRAIAEAEAAFCLASAQMAAVAFFEFMRHWLLYVDINATWSGNQYAAFYLMRGGMLRAQASAGHALALGCLLAIAFGFWLHLQSHVTSRRTKISVGALYWLGLLAAYSRGPWIGALCIYFAFKALGPRAISRVVRAIGVIAVISALVAISPFGERIISVLPFAGGTVDSGSTLYRERVAQRSWDLIQQSPFFGDQLAYLKMEDLRQGEGIIDLVNSYAEVALFYGLTGLSLFIGLILVGVLRAYRWARSQIQTDPDMASLGFSIVACILGTLLMIASDSFSLGPEKMYFVLAGLAAAYANLGSVRKAH
jgi:hypothetical protein